MKDEIYLRLQGFDLVEKESNLKDLATILFSVMPRWVTEQLAIELSKRLSVDLKTVIKTLLEVEEEYSKISRMESLKRLEDTVLSKYEET